MDSPASGITPLPSGTQALRVCLLGLKLFCPLLPWVVQFFAVGSSVPSPQWTVGLSLLSNHWLHTFEMKLHGHLLLFWLCCTCSLSGTGCRDNLIHYVKGMGSHWPQKGGKEFWQLHQQLCQTQKDEPMKVFGHSGSFIPSCQLSPGESTTGRHKAHDKKLVAFNPDRACEAKNRFHSVFVNWSRITFMFIN